MIDKSKTYKTRDGREVRIYATDGFGDYSVHGAVKYEDGWHCNWWKANGYANTFQSGLDLIEVRPRIQREVWVNVYPQGASGAYEQRSIADRMSCPTRIACVRLTIDCEEGEGL